MKCQPYSELSLIVSGFAIAFVLFNGLQYIVNQNVNKYCNILLNRIITVEHITGTSKFCVSRKVLEGPTNLTLPQ